MNHADRRPDVLVIGAGIAGISTAWHLACAGFTVDMIDARHPAWGASGRNPGFLWLQTKPAGVAMKFALAGRRFAEELAQHLPDYGFRSCGGLIIYRDEGLAEVAESFAKDRAAAGLPTTHLAGSEVRRLCPCLAPTIAGAVWNPLDAHQETHRLALLLTAEAQAAGCRFHRETRASHLITSSNRCAGVRLSNGEAISAGTTAIAAGPWSNELLDPLGLHIPMLPVRFEAAETAVAPFELGPVVCGQAIFKLFNPCSTARQELPSHPAEVFPSGFGFTEQIVQFADGTLQFGCAFELGSCDDRPTVAGQAMATSILSENVVGFANLPLQRAWAGIVGQTQDGLPVIDVDPGIEGVIINAGHYFGNLVGALSGRMLSDVLQGRKPPYALAPFRHGRFREAS